MILTKKELLRYIYRFSVQKGKKPREIAKFINKTYGKQVDEIMIRKLCHQYNIKRKDKRYKYNPLLIRKMLYLYENFYDTDRVCEYLKKRYNLELTPHRLTSIASSYGIQKKIKRWTVTQSKLNYLEEKELVKDYLEGKMTLKEICDKYGYKNVHSVRKKVIKYGLKTRSKFESYDLRKTYKTDIFEKINEDWKAYYLGLLLTDGCIQGTVIGLSLIDKDAIEYIANKLNVPIKIREPRGKNHKPSYCIDIRARKLVDDVKRLGLVERKTKILQSPKLYEEEKQFLPQLFKGIIDGDGWIEKNGRGFFISTASKDFAMWCKETLENYFNMKDVKIKEKYKGFYLVGSSKKENMKILKNKIYCYRIGMDRKFKRLHQIKE